MRKILSLTVVSLLLSTTSVYAEVTPPVELPDDTFNQPLVGIGTSIAEMRVPGEERTIGHPVPPAVKRIRIAGEERTIGHSVPPVVKNQSVDPVGVGPARPDWEVFQRQQNPLKHPADPSSSQKIGTLPPPAEARRIRADGMIGPWSDLPKTAMTSAEQAGVGGPHNGQVDLPVIDLQKMAQVLADPSIQFRAMAVTTAVILGTSLYKVIQAGGLLSPGTVKSLAVVVPPGIVEDALGVSGYKVPSHDVYSTDDVLALRDAILESEITQEELETADPELLAYFQVVTDYVRKAKAQELSNFCNSSPAGCL